MDQGKATVTTHECKPSHRHFVYRLTCEQYDALLRRSDGICEMCRLVPATVIDHDHGYGFGGVRGLVCRPCNARLGRIDAGKALVGEVEGRYLSLSACEDEPMHAARRWAEPDVVGVQEVAAMLGRTRQRVDQLIRSRELPRPDKELAGGVRIWWRTSIAQWAARTGRTLIEP